MGIGLGVLTHVCSLSFYAPSLMPFAYAFFGMGGGMFVKGLLRTLTGSLAFLLAIGAAALGMSGYILVTNPPPHAPGFALAAAALGWTFVLVAVGLYQTATAQPTKR